MKPGDASQNKQDECWPNLWEPPRWNRMLGSVGEPRERFPRLTRLALFRPHLQNLSRGLVEVHVVEVKRGIFIYGDAECVLDIVERGSALDDVGWVIG